MDAILRTVDLGYLINRKMAELGFNVAQATELRTPDGSFRMSASDYEKLPIVNYDPSVM